MPNNTIANTHNKDRSAVLLFLTLTLMWSFTWVMGKFQVNKGILPELAIFYRFIVVSLLSFIFAKFAFKQSLKIKLSDFYILLTYAVLCSSLHFTLLYYAAIYMITSISAIIFSFSIIIIAIIRHIFKISNERFLVILISVFCGILGLILIMLQSIAAMQSKDILIGLLFATIATIFYSIGSAFYDIKKSKITLQPLASFTYICLFGAIICFFITIIHTIVKGEAINFIPNIDLSFLLSYLYLIVSGSGMFFFMMLIHKIGATKAAYVNLITPVIAVFISAYFEGYKIQLSTIGGIILIFVSNYIALSKKTRI